MPFENTLSDRRDRIIKPNHDTDSGTERSVPLFSHLQNVYLDLSKTYGIVLCNRYRFLAVTSGVPAKPASWGEEESPHEVEAYQPDMPAEYGERQRNTLAFNSCYLHFACIKYYRGTP